MTDTANTVLHPSILALVSLAANIASNHPKKGLCQLERLRNLGVSDAQIDIVVDIARHLRDEAGQMIDSEFNEAFVPAANDAAKTIAATVGSCCAPTAKGNSCC